MGKKVDQVAGNSPRDNENPSAIPNQTSPSPTSTTSRTTARYLVSVLSKLALGLVSNGGRLLGMDQLAPGGLLALVVCSTLNLSPLLKSSLVSCNSQNRELDTHLATTSWYFQPTSWLSLPTVQYLRPGRSRSTRRAWGTTTRFFLS